jgi:hypothetical protein
MYISKIDVCFFIIESGRNWTIVVKYEVNVKKCDRGNCFLYLNVLWYINGIQLAQIEMLINRTSYLDKMKIKNTLSEESQN